MLNAHHHSLCCLSSHLACLARLLVDSSGRACENSTLWGFLYADESLSIALFESHSVWIKWLSHIFFFSILSMFFLA